MPQNGAASSNRRGRRTSVDIGAANKEIPVPQQLHPHLDTHIPSQAQTTRAAAESAPSSPPLPSFAAPAVMIIGSAGRSSASSADSSIAAVSAAGIDSPPLSASRNGDEELPTSPPPSQCQAHTASTNHSSHHHHSTSSCSSLAFLPHAPTTAGTAAAAHPRVPPFKSPSQQQNQQQQQQRSSVPLASPQKATLSGSSQNSHSTLSTGSAKSTSMSRHQPTLSNSSSAIHHHHQQQQDAANNHSYSGGSSAGLLPAAPSHVKRRLGGSTSNNVGATVLDSITAFPRAVSHLWRFLFLGVVTCLDKVLDLYLLPLRCTLLFQRLTLRHIFLGVFAAGGALALMLHPFGEGPGHAFSYWYHLVQGVSAVRLYVMCSMLEVAERLFANMGGDVMEALWMEVGGGGDLVVTALPNPQSSSYNSSSSSYSSSWTAAAAGGGSPFSSPSASPARGATVEKASEATATASSSVPSGSTTTHTHICSISKKKSTISSSSSSSSLSAKSSSQIPSGTTTASSATSFLRNISLVVAGVFLTSLHAYTIVLQVVVLNVALNGDNYSLVALLASNNFSELRTMVLKRITNEHLFRAACADVIEQMQLVIFFVVMLLRHSMSLGFGTVQISDLFLILLIEIVIDTMKHTFVIRNNGIKESVYSRYEAVWFWDVARDIFQAEYLEDCKQALRDPVVALGLVASVSSSSSSTSAASVSAANTAAVSNSQAMNTTSSSVPAVVVSDVFATGTTTLVATSFSELGGAASAHTSPTSSVAARLSVSVREDAQPFLTTSAGTTPVMSPIAPLPPQQPQTSTPAAAAAAPRAVSSATGNNSNNMRSQSTERKQQKMSSSSVSPATTYTSSPAGAATLPPRLNAPSFFHAAVPSSSTGTTATSTKKHQVSGDSATAPAPAAPATSSTAAVQQHAATASARHFFRNTIFSSVVDESLLLGYPSRRVGLVTVPYVSVLWWISAPLLFGGAATSMRVVFWCVVAVAACKLLIREVNRGFAAAWVCKAKSWGPGRPPPLSTSSSSAVGGGAPPHRATSPLDDLSKQEQQLLESLDRVQQFRFV